MKYGGVAKVRFPLLCCFQRSFREKGERGHSVYGTLACLVSEVVTLCWMMGKYIEGSNSFFVMQKIFAAGTGFKAHDWTRAADLMLLGQAVTRNPLYILMQSPHIQQVARDGKKTTL